MFKKLTLTLLLGVAALIPAHADNVEVDGIHYVTNLDYKTASVTNYQFDALDSFGNPDYYMGDVTIPSTIKYAGDVYTVTSIGRYAFRGCVYLSRVILPNTITEIGEGCFEDCISLSDINIPESVQSIRHDVFTNCPKSLVIHFENETPPYIEAPFKDSDGSGKYIDIIVPNNDAIKEYGNCINGNGVIALIWAEDEYKRKKETTDQTKTDYIITTSALRSTFDFALCKELILDNGPDVALCAKSLKVIGTINWCDFITIRSLSNLTSIDLSETTVVDYYNEIPSGGLSDLRKLERIILPGDLAGIGWSAFSGCTSLQSVGDMPALTSIGASAFSKCTSLQSIGDMPALTSIGASAFSKCTSLQSVGDMPALTSIGASAFSGCTSLQSVGEMPALTSIGASVFSGCTSLQSVGEMPALTSIGASVFSGCTSLQSVGEMPALTSIGETAFSKCTSLQSLGDMPRLTSIGASAFSGCISLQSVGEMPRLTSIGASAFSGCISLQSVGEMPQLETIGSKAFSSCDVADFYLPESVISVVTDAFSAPSLVHFAGVTPPSFTGTKFDALICVPYGCKSVYASALPDMSGSKILIQGLTNFDVKVSARENDSDVLIKVNENYDNDLAYNVLALKVSGTINSYDIIAFRNKMLNLRKLDLSEATIVGSSYEYYAGCHTENNVVGANMFRDLNLTEVILPDNVTEIGESAFESCAKLVSVKLSDNLRSVGDGAFKSCSKLVNIEFPASINSIGSNAFRSCSNLKTVTFPKEVSDNATIGLSAFLNCSKLEEITLPQGITEIRRYSYSYLSSSYGAFSGCSSLKRVILPPSLVGIPAYTFYGCKSLETISLPPTLKSIEANAFEGCTALKEFRIPAGVNSIGASAIPGTVKDVYTYTIQPTSIGQSTFASDTYLNATLHVPETSEALYYWDTQWSQFQSIKNFNEPYSYFYLEDKDLIEDPDTPRIDGEADEETGDKKNPDADLGQGSGLIVSGDESQDLGNVDLEADGKGNGATIIGGDSNTTETGGNVNIDKLNVNIPVVANKWYFFAFPFDVPCENIKFNGQMVWRYYDGEWRAMHGSGSWKDMKGDKLERGRGYIFQGSKNGTLTLTVDNVSFDGQNWNNVLEQFVAANPQDASWNFVGNPFLSFYELADLGFDGPITWWNPNSNSYEAFSPIDDDLSMYPFMAFFVQKPENVDEVEFFSEYRETNNQKNDPNHRSAVSRRRAARREKAVATDRKLINLTVTDGTNSDRTRVVFNSQASGDYEVGVDASKFVSGDAPQLYSIDDRNVRYSINERPFGDGIVKLGFYAPASGAFTIGCTRNDCPVTLKDCQTGRTVTLAAGATYEFTAEKGYDDTRFVLNVKADESSSIDNDIDAPTTDATYYQINGVETDGSRTGLMIEVKGNEATKVIRK